MAVYTDITKQELESFLKGYDLGSLRDFKGIAEGVENSNFLLTMESGQRYILTLYEKRMKREDLPFFLGLMQHLSRQKVPCPLPVADKKGVLLNELKGKAATLVSFLEGKSHKHIQSEHAAEVGRAMAEMHVASWGYTGKRENAMGMHSLRPLFEACAPRADEVQKGLAAEMEHALERLEHHWPKHLPTGVIHADMFPDNVFFEGNKLTGIIDFYFACNDYFAYDLAICLNCWSFENNKEFNITKARHMLHAYNKVRNFSREELEALPVLASGAAMRFLLSRLYDWLNQVEGALVKPKDPMEYLHKLRFHLQVKRHEEYGL